MSKAEILAELEKLSPTEREEVRQRLCELEDEHADQIAHARGEEFRRGATVPKQHDDVFRNARSALK